MMMQKTASTSDTSLVERIQQRLQALAPSECTLTDESALHVGHKGNQGGGHFHLKIVSSHFCQKPQVLRHRMIYQALNDLIPQHIHAISILAISPDDPN